MSDDQLLADSSVDPSSTEHCQQILLQGNDTSNTYPIYAKQVEIVGSKNSSQSRINASNKIKVNKIVNFEWEQRYNHGNMIAVHKSGQYFAYSIRVDNNGKVKVFNKRLNEKVLLKSFKGRVVDLSFAHYDAEVLLGCVDESGCAQIFKITLDQDSKMQTTVVFNVAALQQLTSFNTSLTTPTDSTNQSITSKSLLGSSNTPTKGLLPTANVSRIIWCMYIPDASINANDLPSDSSLSPSDDASKVFVLTRRSRVDIFHLDLVQANYDYSEQLETNEIDQGHLVIDEQDANILSACFSPDGSAIAFSTSAGEVHFYKLNFGPADYEVETNGNDGDGEENENDITPKFEVKGERIAHTKPSKLQKWIPHEGRPVTSIYFLDDHCQKSTTADALFWSFIVTGADYNREIKIWCCSKWTCLQTLSFSPPPSLAPPGMETEKSILPVFKTSIDITSTYLVMSDITRKCFYVLHLFKDPTTDEARCTAVSEYILAYPAISFAIIDSSTRKARKYNQLNNVNSTSAMSADEANFDSLTSENSLPQTMMSSSSSSSSLQQTGSSETDLVTMIRLYCIQTKQLQEMQIFLTGEQSTNAYNNSNSPPPAIQTQPIQPLPFQYNSSPGSSSILHQLLPAASPTATRFNPIASTTDTSLRNSLNGFAKLNLSGSNTSRMKASTSFSSNELKESMTQPAEINSESDYELNNGKLTNSQSIIRSLLPNLKTTQSSNIYSEEDPSIIQIVTPSPQIAGLNIQTTPVLLTPDAFTNSPTNSRNSINGEQKQLKSDVLQSLMSGNNGTINVSNSNNLMSSRASSLTHVTAATNLGQNDLPAQQNNVGNISMGSQNSQGSQKKLKTKKEKQMSPLNRKRNDSSSSSSSCSSCTTNCSGSSSSSESSIMDSADKEIAALSSSGNNIKLVAQIGNASNSSINKINPSSSQSKTSESLLNKVAIENDDSYICNTTTIKHDLVKSNGDTQDLASSSQFQIQSRPFALNPQLNQSWPMPPINSSYQNNASSFQSAENGTGIASTDQDMGELKQLILQMTQALRVQHQEIESLKKQQMSSQVQMKAHIDSAFNKLSQRSESKQSLVTDESQLNSMIQSTLNKHLQPRLEKLCKEEIHKSVQNQFVTRLMEPLREQITRDLAEKLKSIESVLKDSVLKLFKSKSTLDTLSQAIVSSQQSTIVNSYRDTFQKVIVPNFEKSCQNMYQQVNNSFSKGTQDYLVEFDTLAKQHSKKFDESREPILAQMSRFNEQMTSQSTQWANILATNLQQQFEENLRNTNAILQDTIISSVKAIIKEEIHLAMRDQSQTLPDHLINQMRQSGTLTPINQTEMYNQASQSQKEIQYQINTLLKKGMLNSAFQQALCAADLNLLENLCDLVSPSQAFDPNCANPKAKLQQPVILSLIQQLSSDLNSNTDLKVRYLEEAIVNLDMTVPLTIEHSPQVVSTLVDNLQQYIQTHNDKYVKQMRMLLLASKSLLQKQPNSSSQKSLGHMTGMGNSTGSTTRLPFTNENGGASTMNQNLTNQLKKNILHNFDQF